MMEPRKHTRITRKKNPTSITPQQLLELGKLPPHAVDLEEAVLGAVMLDKEALHSVMGILKPECFYKEAHQRIYASISALFVKSDAVDILTVVQELKNTGELEIAGGAFYVTQLTNRIASSANVEMHARIVLEKYLHRELIRISTDTLQKAYEDSEDIFGLLNYAEQNLFSISQTNIRKDFQHIRPAMAETMREIEQASAHKFGGVPSGFLNLDKLTGGWQKSNLIILAARPGSGKTALCIGMARNAAVDHKRPVAVFSLEMTTNELNARFISSEVGLGSDKIRKGELTELDFRNINEKIGPLVDAPIYIDDTPSLSIFEFRSKARRLKMQYDVQLIIVDYLQLMKSGEENVFSTEQEISLISKSLKSIAKELDVPIIALSQLSRAVEIRGGNKRPQLSDLRGSGSLEQDADMVIFIYRPDKAGIMSDDNGNAIIDGMTELIIAKHRNGRTDSVHLMFVDYLTKFMEPSSSIMGFSDIQMPSQKFSDLPPPEKSPLQPNNDFLNQIREGRIDDF